MCGRTRAPCLEPVNEQYPKSPDPYAILGSWYGKRSVREGRPQLLDSAGNSAVPKGFVPVRPVAPCSRPWAPTMAAESHGLRARLLQSCGGHRVGSRAIAAQPRHGPARRRTLQRRADLARAIAIGHSAVGKSTSFEARPTTTCASSTKPSRTPMPRSRATTSNAARAT